MHVFTEQNIKGVLQPQSVPSHREMDGALRGQDEIAGVRSVPGLSPCVMFA